VSLAIHAPGTDFGSTMNCIRYLRDCTQTDLVKMYATFHIFFSTKHIPKQVRIDCNYQTMRFNNDFVNFRYRTLRSCSPRVTIVLCRLRTRWKTRKKLLYPMNVGRNIARESALTHFVLASDIELYPSPFLSERFLNMIARNRPPLNSTNPRIFPLSIFEVESNQTVSVRSYIYFVIFI
jgi:beta-1,4-glucuronyltransferase 1